MRSAAFRTATARQIAREYADLPPGPGLDAAPRLPRSPLPLLTADDINWSSAPVETIPYEGGDLRASTIGYREVAQAGVHALHELQDERDRLAVSNERLRQELRAVRFKSTQQDAAIATGIPPDISATCDDTDSLPGSHPVPRPRSFGLPSISGVRGISGVRRL